MNQMATKTVTKKKIKEVVKKSMPGWRVVTEGAVADAHESEADTQSVDLAALRKKYLGPETADSAQTEQNTPTQIVVVEPVNADAYHRRSGRKAVVVSGDKVIGAQG
jgi:hypothetical protein